MAYLTSFSLFLCLQTAFILADCKLIDMSYAFENNMITWPGMLPFNITLGFKGPILKAPFAISFEMKLSEHTSTHIDAPVHFAESEEESKKQATVDKIPPENLIGEAIVVNITEETLKDRDYQLTVDDLTNWEKKNGKIPDGGVVFLLTGLGKYWGDFEKYMGVNESNAAAGNFHFPGFHEEAAQWLVDNRKIIGIGTDARSFDPGNSTALMAHRIFLGNSIWGLESVANLEQLPVKGAVVYVMPMKIKGGSGGPTRVIAQTDPAGRSSHNTINIFMFFIFSVMCLIMFN